MRAFFICCAVVLLFAGCKKEGGAKVDIYVLQSFSRTVNTSVSPATISIANAVLASTPLVANEDIAHYQKATATFGLKKNIKALIKDFGPDKAFAVTVNGDPVYFGQFHPAYLSSIAFGVATIDPVLYNNKELTIYFATVQGSAVLQALDKRNDNRLLTALKETGRLQ
jgi:hypothetical protein